MKRLIIPPVLLFIIGCTTFSTNLFRTEQVATGVAYTAYQGYTNALANGTLKISGDESNSVKEARLNFSASIGVVEAYRLSYETNASSTTKAAAQAALESALAQSSNLVWLIHRIEGK